MKIPVATMSPMNKPRIAASSYLNAAPLCYSFVHGSLTSKSAFISDAAPSWCSEMLATGDADAALIPVIEYARVGALRIAPGACVASRRKVKSVVLASRVPIEKVRTVALDTSSRTSATLIRILLEHFYGITARYDVAAPVIGEMLRSHDAALIIGDPAMLIDRSSLHVYDLAEEWLKQTGLPFVFAFWAVRVDSAALLADAGIDFGVARAEGISRIDEIAREYSASLGLPVPELESYLRDNISYDLDHEALRGLTLYYDHARRLGLIDSVPDLAFLA
jgi:chorismate dehydratase